MIEKCLRAIGSGNQLGICFIWDIAIEENTALCQSWDVENKLSVAYRNVKKKD